jgi:hypothetical protein
MRYGVSLQRYIMRFASIPVSLMALILLIAVPVGGAPSLHAGSSATYNVSVKVSFSPPFCGINAYSGSQTDIIVCPMTMPNLPSIVVNGTLGWNATRISDTTAVLNVTRDLATFFGNHTVPVFRNTGSFNESINLENRTINVMPFIMPEMDQALQSLTGMSSSTYSMNSISSAMWIRPHIYTMWWVNGPLKANETVPVLVFPTNVTRSTSLTLPSIGTRKAWTLTYNLTRPSPEQDTSDAYPIPAGDNLIASFSFNYDNQSDLLLSAAANFHFGFLEPLPYQPNPCVSSGTTVCSASSSCPTFVQSGINIQATLTLSKTNLNLGQRLGSTGGNGSDSGSTGTTGGSSSGGTSDGSGSGGTTGGPGPGTGSGPGTTTGTGPTGGSNPNPGGTPQSTATKPASGVPWLYWILAIVAVAIVVTSIVFARRRAGKSQSQAPATQSSSWASLTR